MWRQIVNLIPRGNFARRLAWLTGGTLLGQLILVGVMPLLTRLYTPHDFGLFGIIGSLNGIFGIVMACRYEFAIPIVDKDDDAAALVILGAVTTLLLTILSFLLVWGFGDAFAQLTKLPALTPLLWLVPPVLFITGLGQLFEYWSIRRDTIKLNGTSRVAQFGGQAVSQSAFGFMGLGALGLTVGYILGYAARLTLFLVSLPARDRSAIAATQHRRVVQLARELWTYPTYLTASSLVRSGTQFLPTILFATLYGPVVAGGFDLAQRILTVPVRLLSNAASQVFLLEASRRTGRDVLELFKRTVPRFLLLGILAMLPVMLAGPWLFVLLFGEPWRDAGIFAQALVVYQLARFVAVPVSQVFNVFGRQDLEFHTALLNGLALVLTFSYVIWSQCQPPAAVLIYSATSALSQLAMLWLAWRTSVRAAKANVPLRRSQVTNSDERSV